MVGHEDIAGKFDGIDVDGLAQDAEEALPISGVLENVFSLITAAGDVIDSAFVLDTEGAGHAGSLAEGRLVVNNKDLTPYAPSVHR